MPIQAFIDDTWGREGHPNRHFLLAGLYGRADDWLAFADEWQGILDQEPRRELFKWQYVMRQYSHRPDEVDQRMHAYVRAINRHPFTIVSCSLDMRGFQETLGELAAYTDFEDFYFFPFHALIHQVIHEIFLTGQRERCEIFFDEQPIFAPRAKRWYQESLSFLPPELQAIAPIDPLFKTDNEFLPLQAAELIVGFLRREIEGVDHPFKWIRSEIDKDKWSPNSRALSREHWEFVFRESIRNAIAILLKQGPPKVSS